jgi:SWI/SNF-related matrix-associated actin-dependent regulator 1 of chromatin subfamily A
LAKPVIELYEREARPRGSWSPWISDCANVPGLRKEKGSYVGYPDAIEALAQRLDLTGAVVLVDRRTLGLPLSMRASFKGLRKYQEVGVDFLCRHAATGAYLADDVGLGKSAQAIHAMRALGVQRALIVCPAVVKDVWRRELLRWWNIEGHVLEGTSDTFKYGEKSVVIANYEILHAYAPLPMDMIVLDEGHYLANERSRRSTAAKAWASTADLRVLLSATPMNARERDLFNPVNTISPGRFGYYHSKGMRGFTDVYCGAHQETIDRFGTTVWKFEWERELSEARKKHRVAAHAELNMRLGHFMLRRTKQEVMSELPARQRHLIDVDVPDWSRVVVEWDDRDAARRALDLSGQGKIPHAKALITDLMSAGRKVMVFTHRRETATSLAGDLGMPSLTGADPVLTRHKQVAAQPQCLVATMDCLGVGIDLTWFDTIVFVDLDWLPSKILQLEGRLHRFGQRSNIDIYYLIGKGTLDERVRSVVLERLSMYEQVLADGESAQLRGEMSGEVLPHTEEELLQAMRGLILESREEELHP